MDACERARTAWKNRTLPVVLKPITGKLQVRLPEDYLTWPFEVKPRQQTPLLNARKKYWNLPRARFDVLIPDLLNRWDKVWVVQYFTEQKICAPACRRAEKFDCECTCGGESHGIDGPQGAWIDISDALSVGEGEIFKSCRLLTRRSRD